MCLQPSPQPPATEVLLILRVLIPSKSDTSSPPTRDGDALSEHLPLPGLMSLTALSPGLSDTHREAAALLQRHQHRCHRGNAPFPWTPVIQPEPAQFSVHNGPKCAPWQARESAAQRRQPRLIRLATTRNKPADEALAAAACVRAVPPTLLPHSTRDREY